MPSPTPRSKSRQPRQVPLARLSDFVTRRRWLVVGIWLALFCAALPFAARQGERLTGGGFDAPNSESAATQRALEESFPAAGNSDIALALTAPQALTPQRAEARVTEIVDEAERSSAASVPPAAARKAAAALSAGELALLPLRTSEDAPSANDVAGDLRQSLDPGRSEGGVRTFVVGQPAVWAALSEISREDTQKAEVAAMPLIALVLVTLFGSLAAAALPLGLAVVAVLMTGALVYLISMGLEMSIFVTNIASMVGIGVAVDYSLFILARYREAIRRGSDRAEARSEALRTSGLAVAFSGVAVIVSLGGLWMVENQTLRSMALGAMIVVAISILAALTLLPAMISLLGERVEREGRIRVAVLRALSSLRSRLHRGDPPTAPFWERWSERVMRRPGVAAASVTALLVALILPALWVQTGNGALGQFPEGHDAVEGTRIVSEARGAGPDAVRVVAEYPGPASSAANAARTRTLADRIAAEPRIVAVSPPAYVADRALIEAQADTKAAESEASARIVTDLRDRVIPAWESEGAGQAVVGGEAARSMDARDQISDSIWKIFAFVLCLSYAVLFVLLRSVFLPLKAIAMNLLSIGAAYGVLVVVFQWGWLSFVPGLDPHGSLDVMTAPLILALVFGLSMDYEVFLLTRIKERFEAHGDNTRAVAEGLGAGASIISSAALIMVLVFSAFVLTGLPSVQEVGLGSAVAIALDATLIRLVLVPAAMQLMGRWNWWVPDWIDRRLPRIELEGSADGGKRRRGRRRRGAARTASGPLRP